MAFGSSNNSLEKRNEEIIKLIKKQIDEKCPGAVDMIAIAGSFCSGDIYEKSDLDLVIIRNDCSAKCLDTCFILGDIGFDVYTSTWDMFDSMSLYRTPFVTKLFDLKIVYTKDESVLEKYKSYQKKLRTNMKDDKKIDDTISTYFSECKYLINNINEYNQFDTLMAVGRIINLLEYILYMFNHSYVKRGVKRIPDEIRGFDKLPDSFLTIYNNTFQTRDIIELKTIVVTLVKIMELFLNENNINSNKKYVELLDNDILKQDVSADILKGTYEEIFSNWLNKMKHSKGIGNMYFCFMTMYSAQLFYNEMYNNFNIRKIDLISKFNPNSYDSNINAFIEALEEWEKLYDLYCIDINYYKNLRALRDLYKNSSMKNKK